MNPLSEAGAVRRLYWTSFALRLAVGLLALALTQYYNMALMEDALTYSSNASEVAHSWLNGEQSPLLTQTMAGGREAWFMIAVLAGFYCLTGGLEILPLALGCYCLLTSLTPVLAYRAAKQLGVPAQGALSGARLIAYSPAFAFWSGALYKEGLILLAMFLLIEHALRLQRAVRPVSVVVLVACLLALFGLRFYIGGILSLCLLAGLLLGRGNRGSEQAVPAVFRQAFVLLLLALAFSVSGLEGRLDKLLSVSVEDHLTQINNSRRDLASYNSGYLPNTEFTDASSAVRFLPIGLAYFLAVPLPWHFGSFRQNLAIPETLFWIVMVYPRALRGAWRGARATPPGTLFLLLAAIAISCLYALFIGNIGTAYRVRVQVWAILALFAGWGWRRLESAAAPRLAAVRRPALSRPPVARPQPGAVVTNGSHGPPGGNDGPGKRLPP